MTPAIDDDAHWLSIDEAFERLTERVRYGEIAVRELQDALKQGCLRCRAWSTVTGEREPVPSTAWAEWFLWRGTDGLRVVYRPDPHGKAKATVLTVRDFRFYIWQPDFDRLWPAKPTDDSSEVPSSRQPVRAPRQPQQEAAQTAKVTTKDHVVAAFGQMKTKSDNKSELARELAQLVGRPKSWRYSRKELSEWGLCPRRPKHRQHGPLAPLTFPKRPIKPPKGRA
jgi:hypothetical protein